MASVAVLGVFTAPTASAGGIGGDPIMVVTEEPTGGNGGSANGATAGSQGSNLGGSFNFRFSSFGSGDGSGGSGTQQNRGLGKYFAKNGAGGGDSDLIQFASTDPGQVIQITQAKLGENAPMTQGILGKVSLWVDGVISYVDSDLANDVYDGHLGAVVPGIDAEPIPGLLVGLALPYEFGSLDLQQDVSERDYTGIGVMPYTAWRATDDILIAFRAGMSWFDNKVTVNGNGAYGQYDSLTLSADLSGAYTYRMETVNLIGRIGYRQIHDTTTGYTLSNGTPVGDDQSDIGQGRLELTAEYPLGQFTPFVEARLEHEFMSPGKPILNNIVATDDRTGGVVGIGLLTSIAPQLSAGVKFNSAVFREDFERHTFLGEVRLAF